MLVPENPYHLAMNLDPETCGKDTPKLRTSTTTLVSDKVFCSCNLLNHSGCSSVMWSNYLLVNSG
ncbi:hypothetical protein J2X05_000541 [Cellvibrio fibrivorans]|jgi:hypothetical protein|uniref:Uncharacterized protein n=1 Tax=Cellvibrio fibrivorans TaxID=126350 RepID=A0ABU1UTN2_9GAMM|nr:hypothetical protein [Cellvibrio fibrivorans]